MQSEPLVVTRVDPRQRRCLEVVRLQLAGTSLGDVCRAFGLAPTTVSLWRQTVAKGGYEASEARSTSSAPTG